MNETIPNETTQEVGFVKSVRNYLLHLTGLPSAKVNDLIVSELGSKAIVKSLADNEIQALLVKSENPLPQETFHLSPKGFSLPVSEELFGRVINPLGEVIDGKKVLKGVKKQNLSFDVVALGIKDRKEVSEQLETGVIVVDTLIPLGKGQRELIFGEPRSGKTTFLLDTLKTQHDQGTLCIYAILGKSSSEVKEIVLELERNNALARTIVIAADIKDGAPMIAIAPDTALTLGDYYRSQGQEVLILLDDLGSHAKYLREISLLSQTLPGREAYPGDIFYQHAHLMERAGNFNEKAGGGCLTLFPIMETDLENFSSLIPTNIMASTDGHLLFEASLRAEGVYPAINIDGSVTRVGRKTQHPLLKELAARIRPMLVEYQELKNYGIFGTELGERTQEGLRKGEMTLEALKQEPNQHIPIPLQILWLSLLFTNFMKSKDAKFIQENQEKILEILKKSEFTSLLDKKETLNLDILITKLDKQSAIFLKE